MKQHSSGLVIGVALSLIIGAGVLAAVWLGLNSSVALGYEPNVWHATKTGPNSATLTIATFPDSHVCHANAGEPQFDWVTYCPSTSFEVPPNSTITVVISNYDSATQLHNGYFRQVQGTIGGIEMVNNKPMSQVDVGKVAHTFTLQSKPNDPNPLFVSVPVVGVADNAPDNVDIGGNKYPKPNIISFQFQTGAPGTYIWHCYDPCGSGLEGGNEGFGGPMSTTGFMAGTVTVASY